jgi:phosphatidylinositol glycan class T
MAWTRLTNALSGQLCASLNFLDATRSFSPAFNFVPRGVATVEEDDDRANATHFRMGMLPGENVCTENLTPWKKLLPCEAKRGNFDLGNLH